jgi:choline dehydrogenase-like flavoprotein
MIRDALITLRAAVPARVETLVIGSGAGGSLVADYLSKKGEEVLVVEEGALHEEFDGSSTSESFVHSWRSGGAIPVVSNTKLALAEGRCVGGSTMINAGLINSISQETADSWRKRFAIDSFDFTEYEGFRAEIEHSLGARLLDTHNPTDTLFKNAAAALGHPGRDIPTAASVGEPLAKNNMQRTYLKSAVAAGAKILTNSRVTKIIFEGESAVGALVEREGPRGTALVEIRAKKVFVCAGPLQSALLLRRSGVTHNVGNTLKIHPFFRAVAEFGEDTHSYYHPVSSYQVRPTDTPTTIGASISFPSTLSSILSLHLKNEKEFIQKLPRAALFYSAVGGSGKGLVRNLPQGASLVRYTLSESDIRHLSRGYVKLCELLFAAGAKRIFPSALGMEVVESMRQVKKFETEDLPLSQISLIGIHIFSTCPMGENKKLCAVDSFGRVHGVKNLFVEDASILPDSPGVNPQGPLMSVVLRNLTNLF